MSSPSQRRSQSGTPRRSTRSSQALQSSPANANGPSRNGNTPRNTRSSQLASSPLFYQSSSPAEGNNNVSSPLRQNTESQSQNTRDHGSAAPSSPLRHMTHSQTSHRASQNDGDRTPRASGGALIGGKLTYQNTVLGNSDLN
jgi:DNA replication licensing factor MCM4